MSADFDAWLVRYMAFRKEAATLTDKALPIDLAQLQREAQELEPLYSRAEGFRADAEFYSRQSVELKEAKRARIVWAVEDSAGRCRVLSSRAMKVAQQVKIQDAAAPGRYRT